MLFFASLKTKSFWNITVERRSLHQCKVGRPKSFQTDQSLFKDKCICMAKFSFEKSVECSSAQDLLRFQQNTYRYSLFKFWEVFHAFSALFFVLLHRSKWNYSYAHGNYHSSNSWKIQKKNKWKWLQSFHKWLSEPFTPRYFFFSKRFCKQRKKKKSSRFFSD